MANLGHTILQGIEFPNWIFFFSLGLSLFQQMKTYSWEADTLHKHAYLLKMFPTEKSFIWKFSSSPCTDICVDLNPLGHGLLSLFLQCQTPLARPINKDWPGEGSRESIQLLPSPLSMGCLWEERAGNEWPWCTQVAAAALEQGMLQRCKPYDEPDHRKLKHDFAMHTLLKK